MREITCIQLDITTHCNLRCPDCSVGIGINRKLQHHPWEYFEKVAPFIFGIERVDVFGGEPTVHPRFKEFVPKFKELFGCRILSLTTNCAKVREHADVLQHFDFIQATPYEKNGVALEWLQDTVKDVRLFPPGSLQIPRTRIGGGRPCTRAICETVSYADGKFYPCPCGPGIQGATGFEPSFDWKQKLLNWPMPCATCFLSV